MLLVQLITLLLLELLMLKTWYSRYLKKGKARCMWNTASHGMVVRKMYGHMKCWLR